MVKKAEQKHYSLTLFLLKEEVHSTDDAIKNVQTVNKSKVRESTGLTGIIYTAESKSNKPHWLEFANQLSSENLIVSDNISNKAVLVAQIGLRFVALVFGYGRSLLREEMIVRNFGLRVALNIIDPKKMRSVSSASIEDMVVSSQTQSSQSASQEEFGLNIANDIMRGVTGCIQHERFGKTVTGKDSLVINVPMQIDELREKIKLYIEAYNYTIYKEHGFEWVDNINEIKDPLMCENLDVELCDAIDKRDFSQMHAAPPEQIDWERILGFTFNGVGLRQDDPNSYTPDIDLTLYFSRFKLESGDSIAKLKRDRLLAQPADGDNFVICSVYSLIVFQVQYEDNTYVLCAGSWYLINKDFYSTVTRTIATLPEANVLLPDCAADWHEDEYNVEAAKSNKNLCLMDRLLFRVSTSATPIEACDLYSLDKKFIHVKIKGRSSQLSHLFAQGKVSAQCFTLDPDFRKNISEIVKISTGETPFDYQIKPDSNEYEVVYVFIDSKKGELVDRLPFFSLVNLSLAIKELELQHYKCSYKIVIRK